MSIAEQGKMMFTHYVASVSGIRLHSVSAGSGKPIMFLHGHPDFWYLWKDQLTHFAHTHHVIAPDLRGYNLSDKPPRVADYRIPIVVEDIRSRIILACQHSRWLAMIGARSRPGSLQHAILTTLND